MYSLDRRLALLSALDAVGPEHAYWVGRLTLCGSPEDIAAYDAVARDPAPKGSPWPVRRLPERSLFRATMPPQVGAEEGDPALAVRASAEEVLRNRDLATLSTVERAEAARLLALTARVKPVRAGRRYTRSSTGPVDRRRTVRALLRGPDVLLRKARRPRPRKVVLLVDVSGSMSPYADALLRFAHAMVRHRPRWTAVYALGTRLTPLTAALRTRDPQTALRVAGQAIPDWRGGTRLAGTVSAFVRGDGHRGAARRAVVVVFSDGWETGDPARLADAVAHLRRLAARVVWVSPHAGRPGFAPSAGGLAAVLPHIDALVAGHTVAALEELVRSLEVHRA
ncbi:VWA domain-containing protein [Dactylosporangium vinaceum]|uniref:VWA domain-containing protein n=1 Tax=Dactylosporangium vinaceum TaxID=53362 RepID=A0ABV5MBP3_9ACTN|nr:VWA domain-containing protein [Dactylosporangium vinaceum]UAB98505.1 VWA domain-containing protein [Dactylosporangium vinaceum]